MKLCLTCNHKFHANTWQCPQCAYYPLKFPDYYAFAPELTLDETGFKIEHFAKFATLEAKNFWFHARNQLINFAIKNYFSHSKNFFELGCGTGIVLDNIAQNFPHFDLFASDLASTGLQYSARRIPHATFYQMDARQIPFVEEFDLIGAFDVLEHIEEDEQVLAQLYQALAPGGGLILTVPQHQALWSRHDEHLHHVCRYSQAELTNKVVKAGFQPLRTTSFVSLLLPCMILARWLKRKSAENFDCLAELQLPMGLNQLFSSILALEQKFIHAGGNFPVGGSLLLLARKR